MRRPTSVYNVKVILHATLLVVEEQGGKFVSGKQSATTGELPTTRFVTQKVQSVDHSKLIDPKNEAEVEAIIQHFKDAPIDPLKDDDFIKKVKEILAVGVVSERMIGFIVALPHLYNQRKDRTSKLTKIADKYANSNYIGEVGKREEFFLKLIEVQSFEKDGTALNIYKVADQLGNYGYFFAKVGSLSDDKGEAIINKFDCFLVKATPKKQDIGKTGVKETQLSRVRIIEWVGKGSEE